MQLDTVIFDMDGLLIDSEPFWQEAGIETLEQYNVALTLEQYHLTTGLRTREWIDYWWNHFRIGADSAQEASTETRSVANRLYRTCKEMRDELQRAMDGVKEELEKVAEGLREEARKMTEGISTVAADAAETVQSHKANDGRATYAEAVGAQLPLAHPNMLDR